MSPVWIPAASKVRLRSGSEMRPDASMIDENGNGIVISSHYTRERVSVFAKGITAFKSQIDLSEEEHQALSAAQEKLGGK